MAEDYGTSGDIGKDGLGRTLTVYLGGPSTPWACALHTGALVIEGLNAPDPARDMPDVVFSSEGDVWFLSLVIPDANGVCRLSAVPEGTGRLLRFDPRSLNPADWPTAAEMTIRLGQETVIQAP